MALIFLPFWIFFPTWTTLKWTSLCLYLHSLYCLSFHDWSPAMQNCCQKAIVFLLIIEINGSHSINNARKYTFPHRPTCNRCYSCFSVLSSYEYKGIQILGCHLHFLTARPFERLFTHLLDIHSLTWSQATSEAFTLKDFPLGTSSWGFQSTRHTCSS